MSVHSGTLTSRSVHPASPVLLTKNGPLITHHSNAHASNHSLYLIKLNSRYCYPEGNFGRNQLLDGSISLSPLPKFDDRFARQNRCEPPPEFPLASPYSGIVHHLSGPNSYALTQIHPKTSGSVDGAPVRVPTSVRFHCAHGFDTRTLA
ncbi:hypothetical protein N7470_010079 [Penicillium chermesinum]|nr:hypothetical protein N7470_010079 [Penicillium chermesinum]